jgi:hypothetical protein
MRLRYEDGAIRYNLPLKRPRSTERLISITYIDHHRQRQKIWIRESLLPDFFKTEVYRRK